MRRYFYYHINNVTIRVKLKLRNGGLKMIAIAENSRVIFADTANAVGTNTHLDKEIFFDEDTFCFACRMIRV